MENEVKKTRGNGLIIAFLIILILGLVGFIVYDKVLNKENTSTKTIIEKNDVKEENLDKNSLLIQNLYSMVTNGNSCSKNWLYGDNYNNSNEFDFNTANSTTKMKIVAINLQNAKREFIQCTDDISNKLSNNDDKWLSICTTNKLSNRYDSQYAYSKEYVEMVYKTIYGSDKNLDLNAPIFMDAFSGEQYKYVSNLNKYFLYHIEGGGTCAGRYEDSIEKAIKKDNKLLIYENEIFYQDNENKTSESKYIYTFEKDESTGLYYFVSRLKEK